jgi:hypothetical protein
MIYLECMLSNDFIEVSRLFGNYEYSLCLEPFKLYESIVVLKWPNSSKFNTSAMGVRFLDEYTLVLNPYPKTDTYTILKAAIDKKERMQFSVNFTDNVIEFAKVALTGTFKGDSIEELSAQEINIDKDSGVGYLKDGNYILVCESLNEIREYKIDASDYLKEFKGNGQRITFNAQFQIGVKQKYKSKLCHQPTNRGDNLTLEAITLASKLPHMLDSKEKSKEKSPSNREENTVFKMLDKIREYEKEIRRFSADKQALEACSIIDDFLGKLF